MLNQELEFKAWGLSKLTIQNIVVFFFVAQMAGIGYLCKVIIELEASRQSLQTELVKSKDQTAAKIEQLKVEHAADLRRFNEVVQKQLEFQQRLNSALTQMKKVRR